MGECANNVTKKNPEVMSAGQEKEGEKNKTIQNVDCFFKFNILGFYHCSKLL